MSYVSGFMMGTAIIQALRQFMGGGSAMDGLSALGGMGGRMGGMGGMMGGMSRMGGMTGMSGMSGMSRMGGMGSGRSRSQSQSSFDLPSMQASQGPVCQKLELVSSLPGRRRYRLSGMGKEQAELLETSLGKLSYLKEVTANPVSGSLLLIFDDASADQVDELISSVNALFEKQSADASAKQPAMMQGAASPDTSYTGSVTRSIRSAVRSLSMWINQNTGGLFDISSLASVLFFFQGLWKMIQTQQFPSGSQMLWWGISLMRGWRAA